MRLWIAMALALGTCSQVRAWGEEGHRLIAGVTEYYLVPTAEKKIKSLLRAESRYGVKDCPVKTLEDAAVWPDCIRKYPAQYEKTFSWHFDDIPLCGPADHSTYCPDDQCLSGQVPKLIAVLSDPKATLKDRLEALKYVTHFVGDVHQPLHAENNGDKGGNQISVSYPGVRAKNLNLHAFWDVQLVELTQKKGTDPANLVLGISGQDVQNWSQGTVTDWLAESHALAKDLAYARLPIPPACGTAPTGTEALDTGYVQAIDGTISLQLQKAGVRLAKILNEALR